MYELFPGNYRWSYNTLLAISSGGQLGDFALIRDALSAKVGDDDAWHRQWARLADVLEKRAKSGSRWTAAENYFLSSLYHTISEHFIPPADPARLASYREVLRTFDLGREHSNHPVERVLVPFEGTTLPAYFVPAVKRGPAAIFICGLDTTKELWFLRARFQFAARGISALFIDTPGIGEALRFQKLVTRHDYEKPVGAAIDWLEKNPAVDKARIGIVGSSLGGYYIARAAAFEPRLKAAVAWGAIYDYYAVWKRRLEGKGTIAAPRFQLMFITGTNTMEAAVEKVKDFRVADFAGRIRCPFLVMHGAEDQQVLMEDARAMYAAIGSPDKEMVVFDGENGGAAHCQFDNHLPALQICADWIARKL
ncbi:MAG TPA: prolyl oligopeptidase family serine peptidase [Burkholderiales bacterium]|jgi:dienelactone hydrolase|nr:prolyl oligopeptidase family serine peptidase [Burkholderiales bacterium]